MKSAEYETSNHVFRWGFASNSYSHSTTAMFTQIYGCYIYLVIRGMCLSCCVCVMCVCDVTAPLPLSDDCAAVPAQVPASPARRGSEGRRYRWQLPSLQGPSLCFPGDTVHRCDSLSERRCESLTWFHLLIPPTPKHTPSRNKSSKYSGGNVENRMLKCTVGVL